MAENQVFGSGRVQVVDGLQGGEGGGAGGGEEGEGGEDGGLGVVVFWLGAGVGVGVGVGWIGIGTQVRGDADYFHAWVAGWCDLGFGVSEYV